MPVYHKHNPSPELITYIKTGLGITSKHEGIAYPFSFTLPAANIKGWNLKTFPKNKNLIIAGGFIRSFFDNTQAGDIDIYGTGEWKFNYCGWLMSQDKPHEVIRSYNATNVKQESQLNIQFIKDNHNFFGPKDVLDHFDFTCCKAAYVIEYGPSEDVEPTEYLLTHERFFQDVQKKLLTYERYLNGKEEKNISVPDLMPHLFKLIRKGYFLPRTQLYKIFSKYDSSTLSEDNFLKDPLSSAFGEFL